MKHKQLIITLSVLILLIGLSIFINFEESNEELKSPEKITKSEEGWNSFENQLSHEMNVDIISSKTEEPLISGRVEEYPNYKEIDNTLIVFYYEGCGWCTKYLPVLEKIQKEYQNINIYALDLGTNRDVANQYGIMGTPTTIFNGKYKISGYMDQPTLEEFINTLI